MIPVLFKANATNFKTFGIGVLKDCISCEVTEERNGAFECEFKYPTNGALYKELATERLVKAKPNDTAKDQMFRIYRISTPIDGVVTVYAQHLSYDLSNIAALQWSEESISPTLAMERVFANTATPHGFTCQTDYSAAKPFAVSKPQSVRACLGGVAGSFLDQWGGEFEWDNFHVIHHQGRGNHTGVVIEYGKNLTDMEHDDDNTDVFTDLLPYAVSTAEDGTETVITLAKVLIPVVETTLVQRKTYIKDFSEYFDMEEPITEEALRAKANNYVEANPLGIGKPSITVAFEPLWKQPEYAAVLERVSLCDTVTVRHSVLGINMQNSDIIGINGLYFLDAVDSEGEGINFYRSSTTWDRLYSYAGTLYYAPNVATNTHPGTRYTVYHSGGATIPISKGGTGGTTAAAARTNLGITCTSLYSGTLSSGSTTFNYGNYKAYIIAGLPSSSASKMSLIVPKAMITTSDVSWQIADEVNYRGFKLKYSGTTVTLTIGNGSGSITNVYGIN